MDNQQQHTLAMAMQSPISCARELAHPGWTLALIDALAPRPLGNFHAMLFHGSEAEARRAIHGAFAQQPALHGWPQPAELSHCESLGQARAALFARSSTKLLAEEAEHRGQFVSSERGLVQAPISLSKALSIAQGPRPDPRPLFVADRRLTLAMGMMETESRLGSDWGGSPLNFARLARERSLASKKLLEEAANGSAATWLAKDDAVIFGKSLLRAINISAPPREPFLFRATGQLIGEDLASIVSSRVFLLAWSCLLSEPSELLELSSLAATFIANPRSEPHGDEIAEGIARSEDALPGFLEHLRSRHQLSSYEQEAIASLERHHLSIHGSVANLIAPQKNRELRL